MKKVWVGSGLWDEVICGMKDEGCDEVREVKLIVVSDPCILGFRVLVF